MMSVLNVMSSIMMGRRAVLERKDLAEVGDCLAGMGPTFNDQLSVPSSIYGNCTNAS